jgi:hypothetical protein
MKSADTDLYQFLSFLGIQNGNWVLVSEKVSSMIGENVDLYSMKSSDRMKLLNGLRGKK